MVDEKWQKMREIFDSALRRQSEERQKFVLEACGNDKTLLTEVESLLSSLDNADSFMETPAVAKVADIIEAETKKLERGRCFGHYEIMRQIGAGGMGEVYLATDKKLDRQVAVKILNEKFSRDESNLGRFISEAKAASALNHPNILVIHEIGETDETHYIISEFIKGKTLREILEQSSLKLSEILDISIQVASALSTAHESYLIHCDIKPENIMIRPDGYVKILDFGLAKLVEQKNKSILGLDELTAEQNQTVQGVILGTINYMSPEQAKGKQVDERTDIFSFGAVVYEMIAGRTPFAGDSVLETLANLINSEPLPLVQFTANVPDKLQKIVAKTLRKNKDERYQTMQDLFADLRDLRENLTFEEKLQHSAAAPKVLTNGHHFKQNESENDGNQTQISKPVNAYQAYQLARYHFQQMSPPDLIKSRTLLEEAVRFDADFAPVHAALAEQSVFEVIVGLQTPAENFPKAKNALRRAFELNPHSAEFYAAAGYVDLVCDWNFTEAERNLRKALELNSHYVFANNYLGHVFMFQRLPEEAEFYLRRTVEIEPVGLYNRNILMIAYFLARNYQKVIEESEKMLALYPRFFIAAQVRCWALEQTGRAAEAVVEYEKILREPSGEIARRWMGYAYALVGKRENALETAACLVAESREHFVSPTHLAAIYAALNETDKACFYLENALENRDPWLLWIAADPRFDNLRRDSRFDELVKCVGLK
jgi:serine/threonine protein kinase